MRRSPGMRSRRAWAEAETVLGVVLDDPQVGRIGGPGRGGGAPCTGGARDGFQLFQDRYAHAVRTGDVALLAGVCGGKHGRWGRICVLSAGHEERAPHWGSTVEGPVAWIGSAPDDD